MTKPANITELLAAWRNEEPLGPDDEFPDMEDMPAERDHTLNLSCDGEPADLVNGITADNLHPEISNGPEVGVERLTPYDPAEALTDEQAIAWFIADAQETGDPAYIARAHEVAGRARAKNKAK